MGITVALCSAILILLVITYKNIKNELQRIRYHLDDIQKKLDFLKSQQSLSEKTTDHSKIKTSIPEEKSEEAIISVPFSENIATPIVIKKEKKTVTSTINTKTIEHASKKSWRENFMEKNPDLERFIGENLISKIGIFILVLGIVYFVKFAIDKDWINEIARVGIGILSGILVMLFADKLRTKYTTFSSVLVAGAIAIFYFTIAIAFIDYHIFSQKVAFIIMILITAFSTFISVSYNRVELAILSLIGGFAVPFIVSTGSGNHIVLFTYIAILDISILILAYYKKWNSINILSYIFTIMLYFGWLLRQDNIPYKEALFFGFLFYFIFTLVNIINNIRKKNTFSVIELSLLMTNTFLFYTAGMLILKEYHPELRGLFTTLLALFNLSYARVLYKKFNIDKKTIYLFIGLTLTFITLAIPIQFQGNQITIFWAIEAVLLMWLAQKSKIANFKLGSIIIHVLMVFSLLIDWLEIYFYNNTLNIIFNPAFIAGVFAVISFVIVHFLLKKDSEEQMLFNFSFNPKKYSKKTLFVAVLLFYLTSMIEVFYQANSHIASRVAYALPVLYHFIFCIVLVHLYHKSENKTIQRFSIWITILNIIAFTFLFSEIPFKEFYHYLIIGSKKNIIFVFHYLSLICIFYAGFQLYKMNQDKPVFKPKAFTWIASFIIVYIASRETMLISLFFIAETVPNAELQIIKIAYPILWGCISFIFLIIGVKKQWKNLRIVSLVLLGVTILKLFLYDIRNASETGKIIAFILLGILILIISFVYQKIKILVLNDSDHISLNKNTDEQNN